LLLAVAASYAWEVEMDYVHVRGQLPARDGVKGVEVEQIDVQGPGTFRDALSDSTGLTGSTMNLAFKDCGGASTRAKVTDISPRVSPSASKPPSPAREPWIKTFRMALTR